MKNEDKIVELLSEYLLKTDRILDRLDTHDNLFEAMLKQMDAQSKRMDLAYQVIIKHSEQIEKLQQETQELRKESLKREMNNEVLLKEIFSISKRVQTLEEKR
jgi:uncharacterized protein YlxW (UPF0749 family)